MLAARGISVGHGRGLVIDGMELSVDAGCLTVLLGPNGSGKSTLLGALARLLPLQAGAVLLNGADIARLPTKEVARRLGLLPQQPVAPEGLTVADLVARGRFPHQGFLRQWSAEDEACVDRALGMTHLRDLADRPVESLSGGQRQRVWIAMVLAQETPLILLDEPTSFLDLRHQVEIMDMLRALVRDHGRTVVCVLHDLNMAMQYADRVLFLKEGRIRHRLRDMQACTAEMVSDVYDTPVLALPHPQGRAPVFLAVGTGT